MLAVVIVGVKHLFEYGCACLDWFYVTSTGVGVALKLDLSLGLGLGLGFQLGFNLRLLNTLFDVIKQAKATQLRKGLLPCL